jgi:hypothetical protein
MVIMADGFRAKEYDSYYERMLQNVDHKYSVGLIGFGDGEAKSSRRKVRIAWLSGSSMIMTSVSMPQASGTMMFSPVGSAGARNAAMSIPHPEVEVLTNTFEEWISWSEASPQPIQPCMYGLMLSQPSAPF